MFIKYLLLSKLRLSDLVLLSKVMDYFSLQVQSFYKKNGTFEKKHWLTKVFLDSY